MSSLSKQGYHCPICVRVQGPLPLCSFTHDKHMPLAMTGGFIMTHIPLSVAKPLPLSLPLCSILHNVFCFPHALYSGRFSEAGKWEDNEGHWPFTHFGTSSVESNFRNSPGSPFYASITLFSTGTVTGHNLFLVFTATRSTMKMNTIKLQHLIIGYLGLLSIFHQSNILRNVMCLCIFCRTLCFSSLIQK